MPRLSSLAFLVLSAAVTTACSESRPATPTAPSVVGSPAPAGNQGPAIGVIRGFVLDTAFRPLVGARVEVLDGPAAGASTTSHSDGTIIVIGTFDRTTRFRVSTSDHESLTQTWNCSVAECGSNANPWLGFYLRPLAPTVDLTGDYTLTITGAVTCSTLPVESRSRTYPVTLTPRTRDGTADVVGFNGRVHSDEVPERFRTFGIAVAGDYANVILRTGHGDEPGLAEILAGGQYVTFTGAAAGRVNRASTQRIALAFEGAITHTTADIRLAASQCESRNHELLLERR